MRIASPRHKINHPGYQQGCEEALEPAVRALVDGAGQAGWRPDTVFAALSRVAERQSGNYAHETL